MLSFLFRTCVLPLLQHPTWRFRILPSLWQYTSMNRKEFVLSQAMELAAFSNIGGDYLEFGVWKGGSMMTAFHMARRSGGLKGMRFFGFDSYEGLPEKTGLDTTSAQFAKGEYACSLEQVTANLKKNKVDLARVRLVKGWYDKTLNEATRTQESLHRAAVVYIDCDLYESTVPVLQFLTPIVADGTIIIFDDWNCFNARPDMGERRAFQEWLNANPHITAQDFHRFGWSGHSFILNVSPSKT